MPNSVSASADPWLHRLQPSDIESALRSLIRSRQVPDDATPAVVVHDLSALRARFTRLREVFPANTLHAIAVKANPLPRLLRTLVELGAGLEAASYEEVVLAQDAGCPAERIVYDSPARTFTELRRALELGVRINVDSEDELERISTLRESLWKRSIIGLRVSPTMAPGAIAATDVSGPASRFGVTCDETSVEGLFVQYPFLRGLHVHMGSQTHSPEALAEGIKTVCRLVSRLRRKLGDNRVITLDIGGGLPAQYNDGPAMSVAEYAKILREQVPELWRGDYEIVTELGRSMHANCAWATSRVEHVKQRGDTAYVTCHLGADFMLRTAYHPRDWPHEFALFDAQGQQKHGETKLYTIAGPLCFAGDILGRQVALPKVVAGDLLVIRDVGAYTLAMWSRHCSRGLPLVLGYDGDTADSKWHVLRQRERPEDVVAFWNGPAPVQMKLSDAADS